MFTFREFNPVDGYFALIEDASGKLFAKVYSRDAAQKIVDTFNAQIVHAALTA